MSSDKCRKYEQSWHDGFSLKQNYQRCAALEKLRRLPRLKGYKYRGSWIPCAWSAREHGLDAWKRQLSSTSPRPLESA